MSRYGPKPIDPAIRLAAKIERRGPDECWPWTAATNNRGYGVLNIPSLGMVLAHRLTYGFERGPIPADMVVDHTCHRPPCPGGVTDPHRRCNNPAHLQLATDADNSRMGQSPHARNARKTHCVHGHEFTPENTRLDARGARRCRTCLAAWEAARPKRKR